MKIRTKYIHTDNATLAYGHYHDGSVALMLKDGITGEPLCKATVCMSEANAIPEPGNVFIKDWSENEGILASLQEAGVIGPPLHTVDNGWVRAHECKLLIDLDTVTQL